MGKWKNKNYVRHTETDRVKCPYCDAMVMPRGYVNHIRLKHGQKVSSERQLQRNTPAYKQLSLLGDAPPPPDSKTLSDAPKKVQAAAKEDATTVLLWGAAIYFLWRLINSDEKKPKQTLSEAQKLLIARKMRLRRKEL
jgi:hypothetical protein